MRDQSQAGRPNLTRRAWRVRGRVQGVGFRAFVQRHGRALGLAGWVRNLPDGSVEVVAQGAPETLALLREYLQEGPRRAVVRQVEEIPPPEGPSGWWSDFVIR
ncbi:MAG TPA: acylphosphatase [Limnochordales bacterium]